MLSPAPPPEGGRGGAVALRHARDAQGNGRAGRRVGAGRRLFLGGHRRVHRRGGPTLLLPGDEHAAPGRASRHRDGDQPRPGRADRSEEHTSELQSLMRNSYAVLCLKKNKYLVTPQIKYTITILYT